MSYICGRSMLRKGMPFGCSSAQDKRSMDLEGELESQI
jgi:hypothetical protein